MSQDAREGGTSETDPSKGPELHPCDSDALTDALSGPESHTGVVRRPEPPETREDRYISTMWACDEDFMASVREVMALADTERAALTAEADMAEAAWQRESDARDKNFADYTAALAAKDDTIETLTAQRDAANDEANRLRYDLNHPYGEVAQSACGTGCDECAGKP